MQTTQLPQVEQKPYFGVKCATFDEALPLALQCRLVAGKLVGDTRSEDKERRPVGGQQFQNGLASEDCFSSSADFLLRRFLGPDGVRQFSPPNRTAVKHRAL
jgi:hypothetical protein